MPTIVGPEGQQTGVNSEGATPSAASLIKGSREAQLPKQPSTIVGEGGQQTGVNSEGATPTAASLIKGDREAQSPKADSQ